LVGLVGVILTVLYAELGAEEEQVHDDEAHDKEEAREELAGP
jgi:hypothetical protein